MNRLEFFDQLGNIDAKYIDEADEPMKIKSDWKKWVAVAAAFAIFAGAASSSDSVQAAIKKIFRYIPGMTIEEQKNPDAPYVGVLYSMDGDPITQSDENVTVTVQNAYVTPYDVSVVYKVVYDFMGDVEYYYNAKETVEKLQSELDERIIDYIHIQDSDGNFGPFLKCDAKLEIAGEAYSDLNVYGGGSTDEMVYSATVSFDKDTLNEYGRDLPIILKIGDFSFEIKLKPIETYGSIEEIGPTVMHNNISLTAIPRWDRDILYIKIYSINYSEFTQVYGFIDYGDGENGSKPYLTIGGKTVKAQYDGGDGTEFYFDLSDYGFTDEEKAEANFHIPVVEVRNNEEATLNFHINKDGNIDFDNKVKFKYADLNISEMTVGAEEWEDSIGMKFTISNKKDGIRLGEIHFDSINNKKIGGTSSWTERNGDNWEAAFSNDSIDIRDYTSVKISSPTYFIDDEYIFTIK